MFGNSSTKSNEAGQKIEEETIWGTTEVFGTVLTKQGHREFPFGKLKIPPRYYTKFPKIPGDPITSYRPPMGSQSTLNEAFDRGMEKDREREIAQ